MSVVFLSSERIRSSRRMRRVAWTASTFVVLALIGSLVTWKIRRDNAPEEYTPGETSKDITSVLDRTAPANAAPKIQVATGVVASRRIDPLADPGRPLPSGAPEPRFTDVTRLAGLASFRQFQGFRTSQLPEDMGSGVAWGDFDNDGLDDLFVVSAGGPLSMPDSQLATSVLYRNLGDGHFEKVRDFPELRIRGMAAAWGDYNDDGWLDLVITGYDTIILFRNDHGHLVRDKHFPSPKGFWTGATWGDYNKDGYLDLYVCGYVKYKLDPNSVAASSSQFGLEVPYTLNPASFEPERNLLFRNNGNGTFTDVAQQLGVDNPEGRSLGAIWNDFDGDGWPDLYVANDISENKLYLTKNGMFVDAGRNAWIEEYRGSMGLAVGDFDRDGDDDLFISHWVAQGDALYQNLLSEQKGMSSELHFTDVAANMGVGQPSFQRIGWGASFVDIDSDGWPDLVVANGSTFERKGPAPRALEPMPSFLFWNAQGTFFDDLAPWNRSLSQPHVSHGLAVADYNNDGAMDIAVVDQSEGVRLLRNDIPQSNWIELRLHDRVPPSGKPIGFGDGTTVIAWVGGLPLRRTVGSSSYLSQDSHRLHVGLGSATRIDRLEVRWLRGAKETWTNVTANQIYDITQGDRQAKIWTAPGPTANENIAAAHADPTRFADKNVRGGQFDQAARASFWAKQHAAMDAMKREHDCNKAVPLFREALTINPQHEDSHYYLANCLATLANVPAAIAELDILARINPQNHRAFQRRGELLAASATSRNQLKAAREALDSAMRLNSEETGTLILLGQVALVEGKSGEAEQDFAHACLANPHAANAWFLRGYIAWKKHNSQQASAMLTKTLEARGRDWKPKGAVLEGDVQHRMYQESGFLNIFEQAWDGATDPGRAYGKLDSYLSRMR
jgi:enediyne biosynthesis protein E4